MEYFMDEDEGKGVPRQRWAGAVTFVLAAIGSAIGLGNFWRFPYLCFKWGGGVFFIPYLVALMVCGLPMMLLELSLGQLFQRGDIGVFQGIHPKLYGVGLASVFSAFAINIFYTYLIAIACVYFFASF
jgi:solute carrier family 6 GABA transporter-like protein 6/8/11/12/13